MKKILPFIVACLIVFLLAFGAYYVPTVNADRPETTTTTQVVSSGTENWTGNGSENNCESGGTYHWILTAGGGGFDYTSATLYVTYSSGPASVSSGFYCL